MTKDNNFYIKISLKINFGNMTNNENLTGRIRAAH